MDSVLVQDLELTISLIDNLHVVGQVESIPMKHKLKITETIRKSAYGLPIIPAEVDLQTNSIVGFNRFFC